MDATLAFVQRHPEMYEAIEPEGAVRRALLHRFPYALTYEVLAGGGVVVLACGHLSRDEPSGGRSRR